MRQTEELPTVQTSLSPTRDCIDDSKPDIIYANIVQNQEPASENDQLYANNPSHNDYEANDAVIYSEIQNKDSDDHTVSPSGDLQKHRSLPYY